MRKKLLTELMFPRSIEIEERKREILTRIKRRIEWGTRLGFEGHYFRTIYIRTIGGGNKRQLLLLGNSEILSR